jgi:hypothetical protein
MRSLIILGALICIGGFLAFALPSAWMNWKEVVNGDMQQTTLEVIRVPQWVGPSAIAVGVMLMLVGSTLFQRKY